MQQPTCTNVRIRSTGDAHKIFRSIQQGLLHMVTRRLDAEERLALRSGCVYAWEERGPHSEITGLGIERFTEGRRWSPSRVRDEFLFYYEKYSPPADINLVGNSTDLHPPRDWDPLVKQTYSVWVETDKGQRKWHLTAYFTQATIDHLGTIDNIPGVRDVVVTDGLFKSTRVGKRTKADEHNNPSSRVPSSGSRTYAAFPSPYQHQERPGTSSTNPILMHEPYQRRDQAEYYHEQVESYSPRSHSPASPTTSDQYYGDIPSYSGPSRSVRSNSYVDRPISPLRASPYTPQYQIPSAGTVSTNSQSYSNPKTLSAPWANHDSYYYSRPVHSGGGPVSPQSAPSLSFHHNNPSPHVGAAPVGPSSHHITPGAHRPVNYTPSYSLESALTPPESTSGSRGMVIAPLQTSLQYHTGARQCDTPPDSAVVGEDQLEELDQGGLAPLNELKELKRHARYRREPSDEKTLRTIDTVIRF